MVRDLFFFCSLFFVGDGGLTMEIIHNLNNYYPDVTDHSQVIC